MFSTPLRCHSSVFPVQKSTTEQTRSSFGGVQKFSGKRVLWYVFLPPYVWHPHPKYHGPSLKAAKPRGAMCAHPLMLRGFGESSLLDLRAPDYASNWGPACFRSQRRSHEQRQRISWTIRGGYQSLSIKTRVLRQIAPESSPERSAKSLSQKFFGVHFLSLIVSEAHDVFSFDVLGTWLAETCFAQGCFKINVYV